MKWILSESQMQVLLALEGADSLCCFALKPPSQDQLTQALHQLYQRRLVENQAGRITAAASLGPVLRRMQTAQRILHLHFLGGSWPDSLVYAAEDGVTLLEYRRSQWEESLALSKWDKSSWIEELVEGILPPLLPLLAAQPPKDALCTDEGRLQRMLEEGEPLLEITAQAPQPLPEQAPVRRLVLLRWQAADWLVQQADNRTAGIGYSRPAMKALLRRELGEEEE